MLRSDVSRGLGVLPLRVTVQGSHRSFEARGPVSAGRERRVPSMSGGGRGRPSAAAGPLAPRLGVGLAAAASVERRACSAAPSRPAPGAYALRPRASPHTSPANAAGGGIAHALLLLAPNGCGGHRWRMRTEDGRCQPSVAGVRVRMRTVGRGAAFWAARMRHVREAAASRRGARAGGRPSEHGSPASARTSVVR